MMLINPLTRQVLNANPEGCNQYSGQECSGFPRSADDSKSLIEREAGIPVRYKPGVDSTYSAPVHGFNRDLFEALGMETGGHIKVRSGPLERAVALHEVGHHKSGHSNEFAKTDEEMWEPSTERQAWKWALKNRRKLAVSKKRIRQAIREAEFKSGLSRGTLL